jgi:hypothetical protein
MMAGPSELPAHAEACRKMALAASNEETRACLMALAKLWQSTAHDVEKNAKAAGIRRVHCGAPQDKH